MGADQYIKAFDDLLSKDNIISSRTVAEETVKALIKIISHSEWDTAKKLLDIVKGKGTHLMDAHPSHVVIGNMVKRVLKIIREDYELISLGTSGKNEEVAVQNKSLRKLLVAKDQVDYEKSFPQFKETVTDSLRELLSEMETGPDNIAAQSFDYILSDMVIMTAGKSRTVEKFLKKAHSKRKFQVFVVEGAPFYHGQELAKSLAQHGIDTTLIHDSAVFAVMSRVNRVIIGANCVMANGGLKTFCGLHSVALAAKYHAVPLIVCAPIYKLTPQFLRSVDQEGFNHLMSPQDVMPFDDGELISDVEILNPAFDYIPPDLVSIYVSNIGDSSPSYIYKLIEELYNSDDYNE